jgi:hypothetical protein
MPPAPLKGIGEEPSRLRLRFSASASKLSLFNTSHGTRNASPLGGNLIGHRLRGFRAQIEDRDLNAESREVLGKTAAQNTARTGNRRDAAF